MLSCTGTDAAGIPGSGRPISPRTETATPEAMPKLQTVAKVAEQYGVSNVAAAAVASAVLQDVDVPQVVDKSTIFRERRKLRKSFESSRLSPAALYFDGRKGITLVGNKLTVTEEYITLAAEPGSDYLDHVTPDSGSTLHIVEAITDFFASKKHSFDHLDLIGCDSTNVNDGSHGGVITHLGCRVKRPLQWSMSSTHE